MWKYFPTDLRAVSCEITQLYTACSSRQATRFWPASWCFISSSMAISPSEQWCAHHTGATLSEVSRAPAQLSGDPLASRPLSWKPALLIRTIQEKAKLEIASLHKLGARFLELKSVNYKNAKLIMRTLLSTSWKKEKKVGGGLHLGSVRNKPRGVPLEHSWFEGVHFAFHCLFHVLGYS